MLERLTAKTFGPRIGETFLVTADERRIELELIEVTPHPAGRDAPRDPFSIVFRGPVDPALPQGTYAIAHSALGAFDLFLVPVGLEDDGARYEAVFA